MEDITPRQRQVLDFIAAYQHRFGYPPSMREIADGLGVRNLFGVQRHMAALEKKGAIERSPGSSRGIRLNNSIVYPEREERISSGDEPLAHFLPIVGTVRAGMPQTPVEDIQGYYSIDRNLARSGGTFFLRVKGDSMINASICEGDLALIRPQEVANNRDIVVALVDGEATLKRFYRENGRIRLQPENPNYPPIIISGDDGDVSIVGKVVGIYRSLD